MKTELLVEVLERLSLEEFLDLPVGELARNFGCDSKSLNQAFRQHFRLSVAGLKLEIRLLMAASLLKNPEAKVINVAAKCGFNHPGLFRACFRKSFGHSPTEWRKNRGLTESSRRLFKAERGAELQDRASMLKALVAPQYRL